MDRSVSSAEFGLYRLDEVLLLLSRRELTTHFCLVSPRVVCLGSSRPLPVTFNERDGKRCRSPIRRPWPQISYRAFENPHFVKNSFKYALASLDCLATGSVPVQIRMYFPLASRQSRTFPARVILETVLLPKSSFRRLALRQGLKLSLVLI